MSWPKYILRRNDWRILKFRHELPDKDVAEYGRLSDMSLISWRSRHDIFSHHDLLYWGYK